MIEPILFCIFFCLYIEIERVTDTMINVYPRATFKLVLYCAFVTTVNLAVPVSCCSHWKNPSRGSEWCSFALAVVTVVVAAIGFLDNFDFICRTQKNIRPIGAFCLVLQWQFNEFLMSQNNSSLFISKIACQKMCTHSKSLLENVTDQLFIRFVQENWKRGATMLTILRPAHSRTLRVKASFVVAESHSKRNDVRYKICKRKREK